LAVISSRYKQKKTAASNGEEVMTAKQAARALGWFSIGLGMAEVIAPKWLGRQIGAKSHRSHRRWIRSMGLREIAAGVGILSQQRSKDLASWMWARVGGDAIDLALLGAAYAANKKQRERICAAACAVAGVTALDALTTWQLAQGQDPPAEPLVLPEWANTDFDYSRGSVFFVGTATVLLRYAGFTILTDPNFLHQGDHVHLGYGMTSPRLTEPALNIDELPMIDLVVLSHYHGDHFDQIAEARLDKQVPIVTTAHAAAALRSKGFTKARALETWETLEVVKGDARLRISSMPGKHGPGPVNYLLPPVMGRMLEFQSPIGGKALRLYITGDTLLHDDLREIPRRYPDVDLMLIHLGGTRILGLMLTMDAQQGVEMIRLINPRTTVPIHYNDYSVFKSPLSDFVQAVEDAGLGDRVVYLSHGETHEFEVNPNRWQRPEVTTAHQQEKVSHA
jgi:L-ascorbate metabolism protein UlaG (beta-lactamase superfamily)